MTRVNVELADAAKLFDGSQSPSYPHRGPMLDRSVAGFLLDSVREHRKGRSVEVVIALRDRAASAPEETTAREGLRRYFADEADLAALDLRVNRTEGLGSLRYSIPMVLLAGLVAGLLYTHLWSVGGADYLVALSYLIVITIVWVMLWDPIEVLLFDSYFIRLRIRALRKLSNARVTFVYRPAARPGTSSTAG